MTSEPQDAAIPSGLEEPAVHPPMDHGASIAKPALRGSVWTMAGYGASQILRLVSNLILTRLLFPAVFGQMALVFIFIQGLQMFSDVGTGPAIIQNERGDHPGFLRTAWTIQVFRGFALWICSALIAWPAATFYEQPLLVWLIPAAGFTAVLQGLESTSMHTLQRHLQLGRLTLVELVGQVAGMVVTVLLAWGDRAIYGADHPGAVWCVVVGSLAGAVARLVLSFTWLPGIRHRLEWDRAEAKILMSFGRWIFVSTMLTFLAAQSDRLVFGKMIPMDLFGVYGIASMLAALPTQAVQKLGGSVIFPAYSRLAARGDLARVFTRVRLPLLLGGAALVAGLIACGPHLIRVLYDRRYDDAGWILQYLAAVAWFQVLETTIGAALLATGRVTWVAAGSAAKVIGMVVLVPIGFRLGGFPGALGGLVAAEVAKYLTAALGLFLGGQRGFLADLVITALVAASAAGGFYLGVAAATGPHANLQALLASGLLAGGVWAALGLVYFRRERALGLFSREAS